MTAPIGSTTPYTIPANGTSVRITDGVGNAPAGMQLVNRGDNGGTIWLSAGPTGKAAAVPLGPGATMQWSDAATVPYAYLAPGASKPETLVATNQSQAYNNPTTVAAALVNQGIPNTLIQDVLFTSNDAIVPGAVAGPGGIDPVPLLNVARYSSLLVHATWASRSDLPGQTGPAALQFDFGVGVSQVYGNSGWGGTDSALFWVPVIGSQVSVTAMYANCQALTIYGTNRPVPRVQHVPDSQGLRLFWYPPGAMTAGQTYTLSGGDGLPNYGRLAGGCSVSVSCPSAGVLFVNWPGANGSVHAYFGRAQLFGDVQTYQLAMPYTAPVQFQYRPDTNAGYLTVTVVPNT